MTSDLHARHIASARRMASRLGIAVVLVLVPVGAARADPSEGSFASYASRRLEHIRDAIRRGIDRVYRYPVPMTLFPHSGYADAVEHRRYHVLYGTGYHAAATWALLGCGESYQDPKLLRRINRVLASDSPHVIDRGMRSQMLAELPRQRWAQWVHRDGVFLHGALTDLGSFNRRHRGEVSTGPGDNAHAQYGTLGLAGLERAGWGRVNRADWARIDNYWRIAQEKTSGNEPAGWAIRSLGPAHGVATAGGVGYYEQIRSSMTVGAVAVLAVTERVLKGRQIDLGKEGRVSNEVRKGMAWIDRNLSLDDPAEEVDQYFFYYNIQNLGRYTGYRTFNGIDWHRRITDRILADQQADGTWYGLKFEKRWLLSTSFALLYLSRANDPLAIAKIRWQKRARQKVEQKDESGESKASFVEGLTEANWNNRPHDLWNFADHVSDRFEVPATWQIIELEHPVHELIESPILYLATDERFDFPDEQIDRLRGFVEAGGLLLTNAEGANAGPSRSIHQLARKLFADRDLKMMKVDGDHPIRHIHAKNVHVPMQMVHNGVRPLMIHFAKDIGGDLQQFNTKGRGFQILTNIYLYVTGMRPQRRRLENNYVLQLNDSPSRKLSIARITHGGNADPEPRALEQLKAILANDHDIDASVAKLSPRELSDQEIAFLSAVDEFKLSDEEVGALRQWIESGGTIWLDLAGGRAETVPGLRALVGRLSGGAASRPLVASDAIITGGGLDGGTDCRRVRYRSYALRATGPIADPRLEVVEVGGRPAIIFSTLDLTSGLVGLDHWNIFGYSPESARRLVVNGCLEVLARKKAGGE